jgi:dolichol-phosphate mannosyltransferase
MADGSPLLSVVVPVYFEQEVVAEFYARARAAVSGIEAVRHELIFVNDGSTDRTLELLSAIAQRDPAVKVVDLSRNFGHQMAITAGLDHAAGDAVVVIDGDLQDPPEVIADMVRKWREGYKVVYGVRERRKGEPPLRRLAIKVFYRMLSWLSDIPIPLDSGDFRLMDRVVVNQLANFREEDRYLRGLTSWIGFRQCPLTYVRDARYAGHTKYPFGKLLKLALDGVSSFSDKPLRFSSQLGFLITLCALLFMLWVIVGRLLHPGNAVPQGWASVMVAVLFLGGVQLMSVGILGEYIARIFRQTKSRPLYIVASRINFPQAQADDNHPNSKPDNQSEGT